MLDDIILDQERRAGPLKDFACATTTCLFEARLGSKRYSSRVTRRGVVADRSRLPVQFDVACNIAGHKPLSKRKRRPVPDIIGLRTHDLRGSLVELIKERVKNDLVAANDLLRQAGILYSPIEEETIGIVLTPPIED